MTKPLSTTLWCPAVKVGTRWQLAVHNLRSTRARAKKDLPDTFDRHEVKYVKVRIQEVQGAGYSPSRGVKI